MRTVLLLRINILHVVTFVLLFSSGVLAESAPLRTGYLQNDLHHLALWVALKEGFFEKEGAAMRQVGAFKSGPEIMAAFAAGELDMAYVGVAPVTAAAANSRMRVKIIAQANAEGSALVVAASHGSDDLKTLSGQVVAIPAIGSVQDILLHRLLKETGVDPREVKRVVLAPPEMINALKTGQIRAFLAWQPYPAMAETSGVGKVAAESRGIWGNHPCCVLAVRAEILKNRPGQVRAVTKAHERATELITSNPEKAMAIAEKVFGMPSDLIRRAVSSIRYSTKLNVSELEEYARVLSALKYIPDDNQADLVKELTNTVLGEHGP